MFLAAVFKLITHLRKGYGVIFLPFGLVLKHDDIRGADEGETVKFIAKHTTIPVPRVLVVTRGFGCTYFLMRRARGSSLAWEWDSLDHDRRAKIVAQLRSIVEQLRALPSPQPNSRSICGLGGAACKDPRVSSAITFGPFEDEGAFNDRLIEAALPFMDEGKLPGIRARMSDSHRIVFTHGDLAPRNIIVEGDTVVAVIDWEFAGWYPEHWELIKARYSPMIRDRASWLQASRDFIPSDYEYEWNLDRELSSHMVGAF
ncbi:kinase-like protein [Auriscalpium vulgare]|uniref:Kinase-like protein n=1 Tax=Auriscalpium vulgare TaxID=40419 RepID=A0ACB8S5A4_9AGAM|nr:kinase-like protein [Auriscalpium vulgare]